MDKNLQCLNAGDCRRESLGLLHVDFNDNSFGRDSIGFLDANTFFKQTLGADSRSNLPFRNSSFGKESMGLLNLSKLNEDLLEYTNPASPLENKESVGIIINVANTNNSPFFETKSLASPSRYLLEPLERRRSAISSLSSIHDSLSPSMLFSISNRSNLNGAFTDSYQFFDRYKQVNDNSSVFNNAKLLDSNISDVKKIERIASVPNQIDIKSPVEEERRSSLKRCCSVDRAEKKSKNISFRDDYDNILMESVFIEARHFASKLENGFEDYSKEDDDLLNIIEPEWPDNISANQSICNDSDCSGDKNSKVIQNISEILNDTSRSSLNTSRRSNLSKSREAKEILQNLSDIICNGSGAKSEAESLLYSLAGLLCEEGKCSTDDSGNSSIDLNHENEQEEKVICEKESKTLNLSMKSKSSSKLDNSLPAPKDIKKNGSFLNRSFSCGAPSSKQDKPEKKEIKKGFFQALKPDLSKFKPKSSKSGSKNGPLKALVPLSNTIKEKFKAKTPTQEEEQTKKNPRKWMSTPKENMKMAPMAQSTPSESNQVHQTITSPLARPRNDIQASSSKSKNFKACPLRRRNSMEVKNLTERPTLKRTYSAGKEPTVMNALSKVRENISKYKRLQTDTPKKSESKIKSSLSLSRFSGSFPKVRKLGFGDETQ